MFGKIKQMSESMIIAIILALGGGFRDAYSYNCRGQVFANAQTGNLVLLSQSIAKKDPALVLKYILPVFAFFVGVYLTEIIKRSCKEFQIIHWRQIIAMMEVLMLVAVGFMPTSMDHIANVTISLACAMQVQSFRKFHGVSMATTMCTGNLRSATELLSSYHFTGDEEKKTKSRYYYFMILVFGIGAALGAFASDYWGIQSIWLDAIVMMFGFILMFKEETKW
ncbi:MAG: YoaK family protein [Peptostreptococcus sp.]|uniref:YoaK family protein n=1 Tax=Peptostreptococcus sp. TaxID=1262 RepID=UPI002FC9863D